MFERFVNAKFQMPNAKDFGIRHLAFVILRVYGRAVRSVSGLSDRL
jgi:hypothetical protein